jgi:hypothetical protein
LRLENQGINIQGIANNYLNSPGDVTTYLPEHGAYKMDRFSGALLLYGILPTDVSDSALSAEVKSPNPETRNTAAMVWSMTLTEQSFKGLSELGDMKDFSREARNMVHHALTPFEVKVTAPKYTREQMLAKIAQFPDIETDPSQDSAAEDKALDNSAYATLTVEDVTTLREARRKFIRGVSNESVEGYEEISRVLLHLINKLGLYSQYRTRGAS